jgi:hypothetical protein
VKTISFIQIKLNGPDLLLHPYCYCWKSFSCHLWYKHILLNHGRRWFPKFFMFSLLRIRPLLCIYQKKHCCTSLSHFQNFEIHSKQENWDFPKLMRFIIIISSAHSFYGFTFGLVRIQSPLISSAHQFFYIFWWIF